MQNIRKALLVFGGVICVILAFIGIFIPILPTTPFLLLAAFLFTRSSERALHWLENNRWFGGYIRNYREGRGMRMRDKVLTLSLLWITIFLSILYVVDNRWVQVILFGMAAGVTFHLLRLKTYRPETILQQE